MATRWRWVAGGVGAIAVVGLGVLLVPGCIDTADEVAGGPDGEDCAASSVALIRDAHIGRVAAVRDALDDGADPDERDDHGNTPLACAMPVGSPEIVAALLDAGADPDVTDRSGDTVVADAVRFCHDDVLSLLLDAGADPDEAGIDPSPLVQAVDGGRTGAVGLLLDAGAEPDPDPSAEMLRGDEEESECPDPTTDARVEALTLVLDAGGEPDLVVRRAVHLGAWDVVAPALAAGAAADATAPEGLSTLACVDAAPDEVDAAACGPLSGVTALTGEPFDHSDPDADPRQPSLLAHAAWAGEVAVVRALLDAGADPDAVGSGGITALAAAAGAGEEEIVDLLLPLTTVPLPAEAITPSVVAEAAGHTALADRLRTALA